MKTLRLFEIDDKNIDRWDYIEKYQFATRKRREALFRLQRFWAPSFYFSAITGFLAVSYLIGALVAAGFIEDADFTMIIQTWSNSLSIWINERI
jgi:hypothetical protein